MERSLCKEEATCTVAACIVFFILVVYSNTFHVPFLFDDYPNIVDRPALHTDRLSLGNIIDACTRQDRDGKRFPYRPVSNLTFALNYWAGGLNVTGYHLVNIAIHVTAALFLFKTMLLFLAAAPGRFSRDDRLFVAGAASLLWAIHPMQIQAVTYIVQRMASLAAMFCIMGLWAFTRAYVALGKREGGVLPLSAAGVAAFFLAVGSKENAVLLPAAVLLAQGSFFSGCCTPRARRLSLFLSVLMIVPAALLAARHGAGLLDGYSCRPFDLKQRLLTEPRVLFFHVYQLFWPVPENFSIDHSFVVSTSLFSPLTTAAAVFGLAATALAAFAARRRWPVVCFSWLFFLLSHLVESTILPLEIMFEHRNYLPSMFMFLPVAAALRLLINRYRGHVLQWCVVAAACFVFMFVGMCTYVRNYDWRSAKTLWESAAVAAPDLARPLHNLAWYYERIGDTDRAIELYNAALERRVHDKRLKKGLTLECLANVYCRLGRYEKAKELLDRAVSLVEADGGRDPAGKKMLLSYRTKLAQIAAKSDPAAALEDVYGLIGAAKNESPERVFRLYMLGGNIALCLGKPQQALSLFRQAMAVDPENRSALLNIGAAFTSLGDTGRGYWFLSQLARERPGYAPALLYMAENRLVAGRPKEAEALVERLCGKAGGRGVWEIIRGAACGSEQLPPLSACDDTKSLVEDVLNRMVENEAVCR